jgi:hypothetical protein
MEKILNQQKFHALGKMPSKCANIKKSNVWEDVRL